MAQGIKTGGRNWKPGQSGNPRGRPRKDEAMRELVREYLAGSQEVEVGSGKQRRVVVVERRRLLLGAVYKAAVVGGSVMAQKLLLDCGGAESIAALCANDSDKSAIKGARNGTRKQVRRA